MRTIRDEDRDGDDGENLGDGYVLRETDKAILVERDNGDQLWVPKSVLHDDSEVFSDDEAGREGKLIVKRWWARKQDLV